MDQLLIEIPDDMLISDEEVVTLIGQDADDRITAEELGDIMGTINYEITCAISQRVPRVAIDAAHR